MNNFKRNIFKTVEEATSLLPLTTYWYEGYYATGTSHEPGGSMKIQNEFGVEEWIQFVYSNDGCVSYSSSVPPYDIIEMNPCTPQSSNINYRIEDCETLFSYNCAKGSTDFAIGEVIEFIPIADDTLIRCGTISSVTYNNNNPDCIITGLSRSNCGDTIHCGVANPNSGLT